MGKGTLPALLQGQQLIPTNGTIIGLRINATVSPGAGKSFTAYVYVNGSASSLSAVIADTATTAYSSDTLAVSSGDVVGVVYVAAGSAAIAYLSHVVVFESDTSGESILLGSGVNVDQTQTTYYSVANHTGTAGTTEGPLNEVIPTAGVIKNLKVELRFAPGTDPDAFRFTLMLNASPSSLTCTVTAPAAYGEDVDAGHAVTVAAGDLISLKCEPLDTPINVTGLAWGAVFVADVNGESLILGEAPNGFNNTQNSYLAPSSQGQTRVTTESQMTQPMSACTLKKLYIKLANSPYVNSTTLDKYSVYARVAGADYLPVEIVDGGTGNMVGNSGAATQDATDGQMFSLKGVPASSPAAATAHWGLVCYIAPVSTYNESLTLGISGSMDRAGILSAINSSTFALSAVLTRSGLAEMMEAVILSLSAAQDQSGGFSFDEAITLAVQAIEARAANAEMNSGVSLGISAGHGIGSVAEMDAALALSLAIAMLQAGGVEGGVSTYDEAVTLATAMGMSHTTIGNLQEVVTLALAAGQAQSATMTAEAQLALSVACQQIDLAFLDFTNYVELSLSVVAGMQQWGIVPQIAAARHLYNALARKREFDAKERKREYDATARKREYDEE